MTTATPPTMALVRQDKEGRTPVVCAPWPPEGLRTIWPTDWRASSQLVALDGGQDDNALSCTRASNFAKYCIRISSAKSLLKRVPASLAVTWSNP
jgi:hypothetical protein